MGRTGNQGVIRDVVGDEGCDRCGRYVRVVYRRPGSSDDNTTKLLLQQRGLECMAKEKMIKELAKYTVVLPVIY
jgi:hypothetical protein